MVRWLRMKWMYFVASPDFERGYLMFHVRRREALTFFIQILTVT
jgi:hypothetical protein